MSTPAQIVISKFGGLDEVALICGINRWQVQRWSYARDKGGLEGQVPAKHWQRLLDHARKNGIKLRPADLFAAQPEALSA